MEMRNLRQASRSGEDKPEPEAISHVAHAHVLYRIVVPIGPAFCDGCFLPCSGVSYLCHPCDYLLHKSCAIAPSMLSHQGHAHVLVFAVAPPYPDGAFICSACEMLGKGFCFRCNACEFDLHIPCAAASPRQEYTAASTERSVGQTPPAVVNPGIISALETIQTAASLVNTGHQLISGQPQPPDIPADGTDDDCDCDDCEKCAECLCATCCSC